MRKYRLSGKKYSDKAFREMYNENLIQLAEEDKNIIALDADLGSSMSMSIFKVAFPERHIDCGIAEANMVGIAAGMSSEGKIPFIHTFAAFASRRMLDQVFISGAYARKNIKILGSDPGVAAEMNGGTHMAFEDVAIMRAIPQMRIVEFTDDVMLKNLLPKIKDDYGMYYMRAGRKNKCRIYDEESEFDIGKAACLREGQDITIIASGLMVPDALEAAKILEKKGIMAGVIDMFTIKPLDEDIILEAMARTGKIISVENHNAKNGLGSAVAEVIAKHGGAVMDIVGVEEQFGVVGTMDYLKHYFRIDADSIAERAIALVQKK